ncbi:cell envelope-related function transcriptional attenuator common domain protein [Pseudarthrobacter siccitolerans]|uniref:Cell envelope-related function transcriptional attenuator common domain protein n=1 Tax=Pseudarthrobacter siccitolerans TaxID=861266 RepID=A0A024GZA2_9MICC|nr:LCP family protein [Pseudarthrobacter siccitolerans]CCQ44922.1 cell envelope-related function transcriptional attenuator common domain protein [Pseudarthrobacter siccitolerans]
MSTPGGSDPSGTGPSGSHPHGLGWVAHGRRRWIAALVALALVAVAVVAIVNLNRAGTEAQPAATQSASETPTPSETPTETTPAPPPPPPPPPPIPELPAVPMNVLVIGSDMRGNARDAAAHTAATGQPMDQRADVLIVVHVPADRRSLYMISINRDLWVDIPGLGGAKVNSGLQYGGIDMQTAAVQSLLGITIDQTLMLDFGGLKVLVDGLGGIDVNVPVPFQSTHDTGHVFTPGVNHLDGQAALEFSRERYAFIDGDFQRVRNQQILLRAILARLTANGALNDVNAVRGLVDFASCCLTVNKSFDLVQAAILAYSLRNLDVNAIGTMTLPTAGPGFVAGQSVLFPDYGGVNAVGAALREGRIAEFALP